MIGFNAFGRTGATGEWKRKRSEPSAPPIYADREVKADEYDRRDNDLQPQRRVVGKE